MTEQEIIAQQDLDLVQARMMIDSSRRVSDPTKAWTLARWAVKAGQDAGMDIDDGIIGPGYYPVMNYFIKAINAFQAKGE